MDFSKNYGLNFLRNFSPFILGDLDNRSLCILQLVTWKRTVSWKTSTFALYQSRLNTTYHLGSPNPVPEDIKDKYAIGVLHFISDGHNTDITNPGLKSFSWNYLEAGRGKGSGIDKSCGRRRRMCLVFRNCLTESVQGVQRLPFLKSI